MPRAPKPTPAKPCPAKPPKASRSRALRSRASETLDELLTRQANNPALPEVARQWCRNLLAGDSITSEEVAAILARDDERRAKLAAAQGAANKDT